MTADDIPSFILPHQLKQVGVMKGSSFPSGHPSVDICDRASSIFYNYYLSDWHKLSRWLNNVASDYAHDLFFAD